MASRRRLRIVAAVAAGVVALMVGAAVFAWSGIYNVAASSGHFAIVEAFLAFVMRNSVETHAMGVVAPPLSDEDLAILGASHFHGGCAPCHGAPGTPIAPVFRRMLPPPSNLPVAVSEWRGRELFWIVRHGVKYTGMPAWLSERRDDEIWAVVAFLLRLPELDAHGYRALALGEIGDPGEESGRELETPPDTAEASSACVRCHGAGERGPRSGLAPVLHGQSFEFLMAALEAYADGRRESGIMQQIAAGISPELGRDLAGYYARLPPPVVDERGADAAAVERGRLLAEEGDAEAEIPACMACHGADALPAFPRLAGQNAAYVRNQLWLWRSGVIPGTDAASIMAPIAGRLTDAQIADAAAYFASLSRAVEAGGP